MVMCMIFVNFVLCGCALQLLSLAVTQKEMERFWKELNQAYMTEESDDSDDPDVIILHKLNWRSQSKLCVCVGHSVCHSVCVCVGLNKYIQVLDSRKASSRQPPGLVARKRCIIGKPSSSTPPANASTWAIKSWFTSLFLCCMSM